MSVISDYKSKYLKYKSKYNNLKAQLGGAIIFHFHHKDSRIAMAEAITVSSLKDQMTSHGLGTGIYGFVNIDPRVNPDSLIYNKAPNVKSIFTIKNPIILERKWEEDGEIRTDLDNFTWLSMHLNSLATHLYTMREPITSEAVRHFLTLSHLYPNEDGTYEGIPNTIITLEDIVNIITIFIHDYNVLMHHKIEEENYVLMPINYLAYLYGFDGVFNKVNDIASVGSIKYIFDGSVGARGFLPKYKRPALLIGKLIFSKLNLDILKLEKLKKT